MQITKYMKTALRIYCEAIPYHEDFIQPYPLLGGNCYIDDSNNHKIIPIDKYNYEEYVNKALERTLKYAKDVNDLFMMISNPYRLTYLSMIRKELTPGILARILRWVWVHTEYPHQCAVSDLIELFKQAKQRALMVKQERDIYDSFEDKVTVYRGLQSDKAVVRGLSWTTDEEKAAWFATRFMCSSGTYYKATVQKKNIFAYFNGRGEKETVVNSRCLKNVTRIQKGKA